MPHLSESVPAELFLEHNGIKIYRVYRNDDIDEGPRDFRFDTREDSREYGSFCCVDMATKLNIAVPGWNDDLAKMNVLKAAIDAGLITTDEENG